MKKERLIYLDLIRILCIFLVIVIHGVAPIIVKSKVVLSYNYVTMIIIDSICRCSVPLFVMVSGSLLLGNKKSTSYKKILSKIIKLLISLIAFSFFYNIVDKLFRGETFGIDFMKDSVRFILSGNQSNHLWFIYMIIGLYLLIPILNRIISCVEKKEIIYYFVLTIIFSSLIPMALSFTKFSTYQVFSKFNLGVFNIYIAYFLLGYYLNRLSLNKNQIKKTYVLGLLSLFITIIMTLLFSMKRNTFCGIFFEYSSLNVFIYSIFAFIFLKNCFSKISVSEKMKKSITEVSLLTFGVFLIHEFIIDIFTVYYNTLFNKMRLDFPLIGTLIFSIFIFFVSLLVSFIISKIPILNEYLIYYKSKTKKESLVVK